MADEKKPKPVWASKKYGALIIGAWAPMMANQAGYNIPLAILICFTACMLAIAGIEGYLDGLRIKTGRGGPEK